MHAFILAGGFATRLWPLTNARAKPLLPLAGKPILSHIVEKIPEGIPVTVSTNGVFEKDFLSWKESCGFHRKEIYIEIEDSAHDDHKLGALGALARWLEVKNIDDDILVLTGDNYFDFELSDFINSYSSSFSSTPNPTPTPYIAAYDTGDLEQAKAFGTVVLGADGVSVDAFEEKPREPKSTLVSTGCSILPRHTIPLVKEYARAHPDDLGGIFEAFLEQGIPVRCHTFRGLWYDVGSFQAYLEATKAIVRERIITGDGTHLDDQTQHDGSVVLGSGCTVQQSTLHNVVLFDDCTVEDCALENCIVDRDCVLRGVDLYETMLAEGTVLEGK